MQGLVVAILGGGSALASADVLGDGDRTRLACSGVMVSPVAGIPDQPILANGVIDLASMRVNGFGVGSQRIVMLTAARVVFGTAAEAGNVEGSIDRTTGVMRIDVHEADDPSVYVMSMRLDCGFRPFLS